MSRSRESFLLEVDYWRAVLDEAQGITLGFAALQPTLSGLNLDAVMLGIAPAACSFADAESMSRKVGQAFAAVQESWDHLNALLELIKGRLAAMEREREGEYA